MRDYTGDEEIAESNLHNAGGIAYKFHQVTGADADDKEHFQLSVFFYFDSFYFVYDGFVKDFMQEWQAPFAADEEGKGGADGAADKIQDVGLPPPDNRNGNEREDTAGNGWPDNARYFYQNYRNHVDREVAGGERLEGVQVP